MWIIYGLIFSRPALFCTKTFVRSIWFIDVFLFVFQLGLQMFPRFRRGNRELSPRNELSTNHRHLRFQRTVSTAQRTSGVRGKTFHVTGAPIVWATSRLATIGIRRTEAVETCVIGARLSVIRRPANLECAWGILFPCLRVWITGVWLIGICPTKTWRITCIKGNRHITWMCAKVGIAQRQLVLARVVV